MRYRMTFGLPWACLTLLAALTFYAPTPTAGHFLVVSATADHNSNLPDLSLAQVDVDRAALVAERSHVVEPVDGHKLAYTVGNQPLAAWRIAADIGYDRIDPHRRMI